VLSRCSGSADLSKKNPKKRKRIVVPSLKRRNSFARSAMRTSPDYSARPLERTPMIADHFAGHDPLSGLAHAPPVHRAALVVVSRAGCQARQPGRSAVFGLYLIAYAACTVLLVYRRASRGNADLFNPVFNFLYGGGGCSSRRGSRSPPCTSAAAQALFGSLACLSGQPLSDGRLSPR